jgi:small-conductance mechanosensitive channel
MIKSIDIDKTWGSILEWFSNIFWTLDALYQGIIALSALILGFLLYRIARNKVAPIVEKLDVPSTVKRIYRNLIPLLYPLITLIIMLFGTSVVSIEAIGIETNLIQSLMKVIFAWIMIRIAVQFIANSAVRNFFATVIWGIAALSIFGLLGQTTMVLESWAFEIGDFRLSALAVIKSILMIFALLYFAIFMSSFAERRIFKIKSLTRSSQVLMSKVLRVVLIVFALLIGVTSAGIDLSLFAVFGGAIGLGIGFGLQKGISNLFSGMLLLIDQSIKPGDVLELENGTFGWVNNMAARYTEIITRDNKSFLIPNEEFITQRVVNWSHGDSLIRIEVKFGVHYKSNPHEIKALAEETAANASPRVCKDQTPVCHLTEFGDSSLNFKLRFWIKDAEQGLTNIRGEVMLALWDAFKENNIEIPYPHREVYLHETKS